MTLTCTWSGENLGYVTAMMAPIYILANEPLRDPDPHRTAWVIHLITVAPWDVTFRFSGYEGRARPAWTYYWIIKAIGQLPLAYADKTPWDFIEISATVSLDDVPVGVVEVLKGIHE